MGTSTSNLEDYSYNLGLSFWPQLRIPADFIIKLEYLLIRTASYIFLASSLERKLTICAHISVLSCRSFPQLPPSMPPTPYQSVYSEKKSLTLQVHPVPARHDSLNSKVPCGKPDYRYIIFLLSDLLAPLPLPTFGWVPSPCEWLLLTFVLDGLCYSIRFCPQKESTGNGKLKRWKFMKFPELCAWETDEESRITAGDEVFRFSMLLSRFTHLRQRWS